MEDLSAGNRLVISSKQLQIAASVGPDLRAGRFLAGSPVSTGGSEIRPYHVLIRSRMPPFGPITRRQNRPVGKRPARGRADRTGHKQLAWRELVEDTPKT